MACISANQRLPLMVMLEARGQYRRKVRLAVVFVDVVIVVVVSPGCRTGCEFDIRWLHVVVFASSSYCNVVRQSFTKEPECECKACWFGCTVLAWTKYLSYEKPPCCV